MNAELKDKISKIILKNPDVFAMETYVGVCGTTCCIAGWALVLAGRIESPGALSEKVYSRCTYEAFANRLNIRNEAMVLLGISDYQAHRLFQHKHWPIHLRNRYDGGDKSAAVDMMNLIHEESAA